MCVAHTGWLAGSTCSLDSLDPQIISLVISSRPNPQWYNSGCVLMGVKWTTACSGSFSGCELTANDNASDNATCEWTNQSHSRSRSQWHSQMSPPPPSQLCWKYMRLHPLHDLVTEYHWHDDLYIDRNLRRAPLQIARTDLPLASWHKKLYLTVNTFPQICPSHQTQVRHVWVSLCCGSCF